MLKEFTQRAARANWNEQIPPNPLPAKRTAGLVWDQRRPVQFLFARFPEIGAGG